MNEFPRMLRLPPYAFNVVGDIKKELRHQNIDIVDLSMGNPDPPTPRHIVDKMVEAAQKPVNHRIRPTRSMFTLRSSAAPTCAGCPSVRGVTSSTIC